MELNLGTFNVIDVVFAGETVFEEGVLAIDERELRRLILQDSNLSDVRIEIVKPGEHKRIIHVLDVLEPRIKLDNGLASFPGFLSSPLTAGRGTT